MSLTSLKTAFGRFYGRQSRTLNSFNPPLHSLEQIANGLATYTLCANTISYLLGELDKRTRQSTSKDHGLLRFLVFQHVELMGMQIYKMVLMCINQLPAINPGQFLAAVETPESQVLLGEIMKLALGLDSPNRPDPTYYWRYARLVDPTFFVNFSMSRNVHFGFLIACIMNHRGLVGNKDYSNPKNIRAFDGIRNNQLLTDELEHRATLFDMLYQSLETELVDGVGIAMKMARDIRLTKTTKRQEPGVVIGGKRPRHDDQPLLPIATDQPPTVATTSQTRPHGS